MFACLGGFRTQRNVNSAANFVFTSKISLPRMVVVGLNVPEIFVSPHLEFKQHNLCTVAIPGQILAP